MPTTHHHRTLEVPAAKALAYIQDIPKLVRLNPLVVAIEKDPDHDNKWTVTDRIVLLGRVRYKLDVKLVEGGCDVDVTAPMEDVTASMPKILAPFVNKTQYQSHEAMFNRLTEELTKEQA